MSSGNPTVAEAIYRFAAESGNVMQPEFRQPIRTVSTTATDEEGH